MQEHELHLLKLLLIVPFFVGAEEPEHIPLTRFIKQAKIKLRRHRRTQKQIRKSMIVGPELSIGYVALCVGMRAQVGYIKELPFTISSQVFIFHALSRTCPVHKQESSKFVSNRLWFLAVNRLLDKSDHLISALSEICMCFYVPGSLTVGGGGLQPKNQKYRKKIPKATANFKFGTGFFVFLGWNTPPPPPVTQPISIKYRHDRDFENLPIKA